MTRNRFACQESTPMHVALVRVALVRVALIVLTGLIGFRCSQVESGESPSQEISFNRQIRPLLADRCFRCHGPDRTSAEAQNTDLRLDLRDLAIESGAIVPGQPEQSELVARVSSDDEAIRMPPPEAHKPAFSPQEVSTLRRWIEQGAAYQPHWSFVKPTRPAIPKVWNRDWPRDAIDSFVLARLEKRGLQPSPEADRHTLIRRVYLDLIGLPPSPAQVDAFVNDKSPQAYQRVVDQLLASPGFGERWAQMWLDLVRYADSMGYEKDRPRTIWPYRDWVIEALNNDMPFDQFTIEQLAGDLLPEATENQLLATAMHRNTMTNEEGGTDNEEFRVAAVKDRVDTTLQVWMGLTAGCAQCHSHKYDPISHAEYYQLYAFLNSTADADRGDEFPTRRLITPGQRQRLAALQARQKQLEQTLPIEEPAFDRAFQKWQQQLVEAHPWQVLQTEKAVSQQGAKLTPLPDGSILASGPTPTRDRYQVTGSTSLKKITAIRIEALTHPSLVRQGPGRNGRDPNFVINELVMTITSQQGSQQKGPEGQAPRVQQHAIALTNPRADFSQKGWGVAGAIDGNPKTGWAISPQFGQPHVAVFDLAEPLTVPPESRLQFTITQHYGNRLVLGCFRLSVSQVDPAQLQAKVATLAELARTPVQQRTAQQQQRLQGAFLSVHPPTAQRSQRLATLKKQIAAIHQQTPKTPILQELPAGKKRITRIHQRGNFLTPGEVVSPDVPKAFGPWPKGLPKDRLGLARWLVHSDNPLTARVQVNRLWARLFGRGLVLTEEDFGNMGTPPTHPELLDWLAVEFASDWSLKGILRQIVTSATYRQSSRASDQLRSADFDNQLLARGPRFRLEAEIIRDQALAAAGLLSDKMYGPSVMPPQPPGVWRAVYSGLKWKAATGEDRYRRGLYTFWRRTSPYPSMVTFDAGTREVCLVRRVRTNTPLQALVTLNDPVYVEAAGALAKRMLTEAPKTSRQADIAASIRCGFRLVAVRDPADYELQRLQKLFGEVAEHFSQHVAAAKELQEETRMRPPEGIASEEFAAWVVLANVLLNLDEVMMKN